MQGAFATLPVLSVKLNALKTFPLKHHYITNLFHAIMHNNPEEANVTSLKGYFDTALRPLCTVRSKPSLPLNLVFQSPNSSAPLPPRLS